MFYATGVGGAIAPVYRREDTPKAEGKLHYGNQNTPKTPKLALVNKDQGRRTKQA